MLKDAFNVEISMGYWTSGNIEIFYPSMWINFNWINRCLEMYLFLSKYLI